MISAADFVHLPCTPDLIEGGIAYACQSLPHIYQPREASPPTRLRRLAAAVGVELAFRRYLAAQDIPFGVRNLTPFASPERFDVALGGRRCEIKSFFISRRLQVAALRVQPGLALKAPALVPLDHYSTDGQSADDLYLFAFLTGTVAQSAGHAPRAAGNGARTFLIHVMPRAWARPDAWISLGPLALKSDSDQSIRLELGGQDAGRNFVTRSVELPRRTRVEVEVDFHSLAFVHAEKAPGGQLGVHSPSRRETYLIGPRDWRDIWVQGQDLFLTGWMPRDEFRRRARLIPEGRRVFQFDETRTKNLAVAMSDMRPLAELLDRVRAWVSTRPGVPTQRQSA
jgi:hypothetical protein